MNKILKDFRYGEKGFTLIELLVVIAIIGVLAAVAVPNMGKFIGEGEEEAMETELHNVKTAVLAAMTDSHSKIVVTVPDQTPPAHRNFGNTQHDDDPDTGTDLRVATVFSVEYWIGDYIIGGANAVYGHYWIYRDGTVVTRWYPGIGIVTS